MATAGNAFMQASVEFVDDTQRLIRGILYGGVLAVPFWLAVLALLLR